MRGIKIITGHMVYNLNHNQILQLKATKGRIIFGRKNDNSGHSDRDERKKYERIAAASIDQTVFTHGRKKK